MIKRLLIAGVALAVVIAGVGTFALVRRPTPGVALEVDVPSGATTTQVAEMLSSKEVIGSTLAFRVLAKLRGLDGRIAAGRYEMAKGIGAQAALDIISNGPIEKGKSVAFPEGFALKQVAARIGARTHVTEAAFLQTATDGSVRAEIEPPNIKTLEGFLFPETYVVGERDDAKSLVSRMVREFEARTADLDWSYAESKGLSKYQALVIASLVEREARLDEDRPKVAAVIYNRLAKGMRLQIDITALYGLDEHKVPVPSDLRRPSPYNTYLIDGLPPTPIANPGLDSLRAALKPADINAIYYVVIHPSGKEGFTDSPQEFERLKRLRPPEVH